MPSRRLRLLVAVLAVLVAVAWATGAFERDPTTVDVPDLAIPEARLERIGLSGAMELTLVRADSAWRVTEPEPAAADSAVVARLVGSLGDLRIASLVTSRADRHARFGLDSTATRIDLGWDGGSMALTVSRRGPDWQSHYVTIGEGPEVYATATRVSLPASVEAVVRDLPGPAGGAPPVP